MKIKILGWEKFNDKRKDVKHPSWFRLENKFPQSESLYTCTVRERYVYVTLLCLASQRQSADLEFNEEWFCAQFAGGGLLPEDIHSTIQKLNGKCIECVPDTVRARDVRGTRQTDITDITDKTLHNSSRAPGRGTEGGLVWDSYCEAYRRRYQVEPVRNAKTNSLCKQIATRLPGGDAPQVAAFFLTHENPRYVQSGHGLGLLLMDCEKLRTEWATGNVIKPNHQKTFAEIRSNANAELFKKVDRGEV